jgi:DNA-binding SARP family transcriptional activator
MKTISFLVLGPLEVRVSGRALPLGGPKPRMLLAALLLQPNVVVSTELLIDVLWPTTAPRSAAANIRTYVHSLRRRLAENDPGLADRIQSRSSGYILTSAPDEVDRTAFERHASEAQKALGEGKPEVALAELDYAEQLWRGEILEGLQHDHSWGSAVARLDELRLSVQEQRLKVRIELGRCAEAIVELRGLVEAHPLREELWQQLIMALLASGRKAEALQSYKEIERILREELDAPPGPRLRELRTNMSPNPAPGKPSARPSARFPICQLPLDLPDFTGRENVVGELVALLNHRRRSGKPTVAVLSGAPGVGKSSIAVRLAHAVRADFPDGQLHLDLAGTSSSPRTPMAVLAELLRALGVPDAGMPRVEAERAALMRSQLAGRRLCIVLDDAVSTAQVRPLLPGSGACAVLITSRARMPDLAAAQSIDVDLLPEREAASLLAGIIGPTRMRAEPESAAEILRYCGYLPLALRVVGSKLTHRTGWTLKMLATRLKDEHRRLDELRAGDLAVRASVTLSYDLLPADAAHAFRGLGSLGSVTFPAWVISALLDKNDADEVLDTLVDAHLVELVGSDVTGQPRYRLHDLLRVYAAEQPGSYDETAVRRVIEGYLSLAVEAAERMPIHFFGMFRSAGHDEGKLPSGAEGLLDDPNAWFEAEHHTGVAFIALAAEHGLDDLAWRLTAAFTPYFDLRGHQDDWHHTHAIALAAARRSGDVGGQALVLRNIGQVQLYQDKYDESLVSFEESCRLFRAIGNERGVAIALAGLGAVRRIRGENEHALDLCHEALALFGKVGDRNGEALARTATGVIWLAWRCYAVAGRWFTDAYELSAEIGDRHREALALKRLALLHQHRGNLAAAREELNRSIAILDELGDDHCVGYANQHLGELCLRTGDYAHAQLLLVNSLSVHRRNGDRRSEAEVSERLGELHDALGQRERARTYSEQALALWRELAAGPQETALAARLQEAAESSYALPSTSTEKSQVARRHIASA